MAKLMRNVLATVKIESVVGTDPVPTSLLNAILCRISNPQPVVAEFAQRNNITPYFGSQGQVQVAVHSECDLEVELAAAGGAGLAPGWGPLMRASAFSQTLSTVACAITSSAGTATLTKVAHGRIAGDSIVVSGATQPEYNGTFTVLTAPTADTLTYAVTGSPATPATGSPLLGISAVYTPVTSSLETVTLYYYLDGLRHIMTSCRANVSIELNAKGIPMLKFSLTGLYTATTDTVLPTDGVLTGFKAPLAVNKVNTPSWSIHGVTGALQKLTIDMGNEIAYRNLIGSEAVVMTDRKPKGSASFEMTSVATYAWHEKVRLGTLGALAIQHGTVGGQIITLAAPKAQLLSPSYSESDGIAMLDCGLDLQPNAGNDELIITVK